MHDKITQRIHRAEQFLDNAAATLDKRDLGSTRLRLEAAALEIRSALDDLAKAQHIEYVYAEDRACECSTLGVFGCSVHH
jgi:hypothetical protein